ncbi:putative stress response RCI peptide [Xylariaceae sp. FL1019]|nr:putative stress response RCI peptide [Xylariaceae sp. FL1019]
MCSPDIFLGLIAILFPPLSVWVRRGICSVDSLINILLCLLGYIPGLLHAWYIIAKFPESSDYERVPQDQEHGHTHTYHVFVPNPNNGRQQQPKPSSNMNYGSTNNSNANAGSSSAGPANEGGDPAPPTYAEAVKGDNKIQTQD